MLKDFEKDIKSNLATIKGQMEGLESSGPH